MTTFKNLLQQKTIFCPKCSRSMFVGLNCRYISHTLKHTAINSIFVLLAVVFLISFYPSSISVMSAKKNAPKKYVTDEYRQQEKVVSQILLRFSSMERDQIRKITQIILKNSQNKNLDPKLIASIIVVESSGNSLAISAKKAVGIMQIHVPTWGRVVNFAERNPFDPEVNIDMGTTILADYLKRYQLLETALSAYEGSLGLPSSYPAKVLAIYYSRLQ